MSVSYTIISTKEKKEIVHNICYSNLSSHCLSTKGGLKYIEFPFATNSVNVTLPHNILYYKELQKSFFRPFFYDVRKDWIKQGCAKVRCDIPSVQMYAALFALRYPNEYQYAVQGMEVMIAKGIEPKVALIACMNFIPAGSKDWRANTDHHGVFNGATVTLEGLVDQFKNGLPEDSGAIFSKCKRKEKMVMNYLSPNTNREKLLSGGYYYKESIVIDRLKQLQEKINE